MSGNAPRNRSGAPKKAIEEAVGAAHAYPDERRAAAVRQQLAEMGFAGADADDGLLRACDYDVARVIDRLVSKLRKAEQELSVANAALSAALSAKDQELARLRGIGVEDLEERELKELQATLQEGQRRVSDALLRPEAERRTGYVSQAEGRRQKRAI